MLRAINRSVALCASLALLTLASCADTGGGGDCGATTCPGCCTPLGFCVLPTSQTSQQCGRGGTLCQRCNSPETCLLETGTCGREGMLGNGITSSITPCGLTCDGCCQINAQTNQPECVTYAQQNDEVCGESNNSCQPCASGETCHVGVCKAKPPCTPGQGNCPCDATVNECFSPQLQTCVVGNSQQACGNSGGMCEPCDVGYSCVRGVCKKGDQCTAECEREGCCDSQGHCIKYRTTDSSIGFVGEFFGQYEQNDGQCGAGGAKCAPCPVNRYNQPTTCNSRGQCVTGQSDIEICVNTVQVSCETEAACDGLSLYVEVIVGDVSKDTKTVRGQSIDVSVYERQFQFGDCVEVNGEDASGRQVTFKLQKGGFYLFDQVLGTCQTSLSGTSSYVFDSGGGTDLAKQSGACSNGIKTFTIYTRTLGK